MKFTWLEIFFRISIKQRYILDGRFIHPRPPPYLYRTFLKMLFIAGPAAAVRRSFQFSNQKIRLIREVKVEGDG